MAVVMLIMGSLLSGLLVALTQTTENNRIRAAESQLQRIEEALYSYAQVNGRLPCPATSTSAGLESQSVGGATCTQPHGFVPNSTLGLYGQINDDGLLRDPWTNPYRYSVSTGDKLFTTSANVQTLFQTPALLVADANNMIQICEENTCLVNAPLTVVAPAVVFSMGENWTTTNSTCGAVANADEAINAGAAFDATDLNQRYCLANVNNRTFISTTYVEDVYDDIVIWLSPHVLFGKLVTAGQLP